MARSQGQSRCWYYLAHASRAVKLGTPSSKLVRDFYSCEHCVHSCLGFQYMFIEQPNSSAFVLTYMCVGFTFAFLPCKI